MLYTIAGVVAVAAWLILGRDCLLIFAGLMFVSSNLHWLADTVWSIWEVLKMKEERKNAKG